MRLLVLLLFVLVGCATSAPSVPTGRAKVDLAPVRTDPEPVTARWPGIGAIQQVHWVGGTLGDDRVPGPSRYFVEAVVAIGPAAAERLATDRGFVPATDRPAPPPSLRVFAGDGPWLRSAAVDATVGPPAWGSTLHLDPVRGVVYISATGE